jgi:cytochrome c5
VLRLNLLTALLLSVYAVITFAGDDRYKSFDDEHLQYGKTIWLGTCEGCHGWGVADAPIPMNYEEWEHRIAKGKDVLYQHAIEGFFGPDDSMMPERGGNLSLSDDEVKAAVDYMYELALSHKN